MKKTQFKGYLLEEITSHLIRTSGYSLIPTAPTNDPDLTNAPNGLNIRGRGAQHQVDVLGEMSWIPSFTFPVRLIVEAKFRSTPTGVDVVRSEIGVLNDVNENYFVVEGGEPRPRYRYSSVIVSTSGFTKPAVSMAIAHQIQLVDLSSADYERLRNAINTFTDSVAVGDEVSSETLSKIRYALRVMLEIPTNHDAAIDYRDIQEDLETLIQSINSYNELFVGMSQGGFMLLMKADNPSNFINYAREHQTHDVTIHWVSVDEGKIWSIKPMRGEQYTLKFKLPDELHRWIFRITENRLEEALNQKERNFSRISIYYRDPQDGNEYIFKLKFNRLNLQQDNE